MKRGKCLAILGKLINSINKKGDKNKCRNYTGISFVCVGSQILSMMIFFRFRYAVDKVLGEEQGGFWKGGGYIDIIFIPRLIMWK